MWAKLRLAHQLRRAYWRALRPTTLGSRCIVLSGGSVLLVRHTYERWWYLPGGGVKRGESFADAAQREVREETGLRVQALKLLHLYHSRNEGKSDHVAVFVATDCSERPCAACDEVGEVAFFPVHDLPPDVSPATRRWISEYLTGDFAGSW